MTHSAERLLVTVMSPRYPCAQKQVLIDSALQAEMLYIQYALNKLLSINSSVCAQIKKETQHVNHGALRILFPVFMLS